MKIDDIAKQLANKVNQEHYIRHYLEKVQRGAYDKGFKDAEEKQLNIGGVSHQKELLAFRKWQKDNWKDIYLYSDEFMISEFKKANCGIT